MSRRSRAVGAFITAAIIGLYHRLAILSQVDVRLAVGATLRRLLGDGGAG